MALKSIVVNGYTVTITPTNNPPGSYYSFSIMQITSVKNLINGKGIINGPTIAWSTNSLCANSGNGYGSFSTNSSKCFSDGCDVFLEGVTGMCYGAFYGPLGIPTNCVCTFTITNAGQSKVTGQ